MALPITKQTGCDPGSNKPTGTLPVATKTPASALLLSKIKMADSRKLGIATGNFWRFFFPKDQNKILALLKPICEKHSIKAIELTYSFMNELDVPLSQESINFLKTMDYVSIHCPFYLSEERHEKFDVKKDKNMKKLFEKISYIYQQVNSKILIVHPEQISSLEDLDYFAKKFSLNIVTEIESPEKFGLDEFMQFIDNTNFQFVFDTGHAEFHDIENIKKLIERFSSKICQVHLNKVADGKAHRAFYKNKISETVKLVKELNIPFMIEEDLDKGHEKELEEEIIFLKEKINLD